MRTTEQRSMFGARNMIMWEEQLVDPPIEPLIKKTVNCLGTLKTSITF